MYVVFNILSALDRNRTCDLPLRRRSLYPTELRGLTADDTLCISSSHEQSKLPTLQTHEKIGIGHSDIVLFSILMNDANIRHNAKSSC